MTHRSHKWRQETVMLSPDKGARIAGATVVWTCRCMAVSTKDYIFRKPSGKEGVRKPTEDDKFAALLAADRAEWPDVAQALMKVEV